VNAVPHRSYSLQGDGIRVTQFDDRLEVESPGRLPGPVRIDNIRHTRFARNPHIARVLAEMTGYVRELNEGVKRIFEEMEQYGLHPPVYTVTDSTVRVTLYKRSEERGSDEQSEVHLSWLRERLGERRLHSLLVTLREQEEMSSRQVAELLNVTPPTARSYLRVLEGIGMVSRRRESPRDPMAVWVVSESPLWQRSALPRAAT
jgi:ATP-dependent DNA helicase RecG